jgi:hypothetical protein
MAAMAATLISRLYLFLIMVFSGSFFGARTEHSPNAHTNAVPRYITRYCITSYGHGAPAHAPNLQIIVRLLYNIIYYCSDSRVRWARIRRSDARRECLAGLSVIAYGTAGIGLPPVAC